MNEPRPPADPGPFRPPALLRGGHRQTLAGHWLRAFLRWPLPVVDLPVDAGEGVRLLLRATWQPGRHEDHPALVVVHGLGGDDRSSYSVALGRLAWARGFHVVRMNMRGSGDGEALCPLLYNAGLDTDLLAVVDEIARRVPRVAVAGFSLGGNLALLMLGRLRGVLPRALRAVAAVSPPLDLAACAEAIDAPANHLYQRRFVRMLGRAYQRRTRSRPDLFPAGRERGLRSVREYDEAITAPYGGYASAADYYARSSAGPWLAAIDRPALVLAAADDPMIPVDTVTRWPLSSSVEREITPTGGHVGFVGPSRAPGWFWAADRVMGFVEAGRSPERQRLSSRVLL
jgi:predicted alpha/beta-fold hydrolase